MHVLVQEDVLGFKVSVYDVLLVQELHGHQELAGVELGAVHLLLGHVVYELEQVAVPGV